MGRLGRPWLLGVAAPLLALLLAAGYLGGRHLLLNHRADPAGKQVVVTVPKGAGLEQVASALTKAGVVDHPLLFDLAARLMGVHRRLKAGEYALSPAMTYAVILDYLARGRVLLHPVLIPEGFTAEQIIERLAAAGLVDPKRARELVNDPEFAAELGIKAPGLEGYLFPAVYRLPRGLSARAVLSRMVRRFNEAWAPLAGEARARGMTRLQAVILASIIEREARLDSERPLISAVYHNRLKKGMPLQADPTVIYGLEDFNGNLTRGQLKADTPYNTYTRGGLPPGPICSPGAASLKAAVEPADVPYLYFVAKGDGGHHFSKGYRDHVNAVNRYQRHRR